VIPEISYTEMLELAAGGAQVMHARAIEIASRFDVDVWVGSSFEEGEHSAGTLITRTPKRMEDLVLTGITAQRGHAKLVIRGLPPGMHSLTAILVALAEDGVSVDMISEAQDPGGGMQLQVTVAEAQADDAVRLAEQVLRASGGAGSVEARHGLSRVALVGSGMHQRPGVYARAFRTLLEGDIEVYAVSTSGISITLWVPAAREDDAVRALHDAFSLELAGTGAAGGAS
jgi:aspartate kinase